MTLDGKIASYTRDSKWITGEEARTYAHLLRKQHDAILVGIGTVLEDDPELTTRMVKGKNPIRIVLDSTLKVSLMSAVLNAAAETIIVTGLEADAIKAEAISALPNVEVIRLPLENGKIPLDLLIIHWLIETLPACWLKVAVKFTVLSKTQAWQIECMASLHRRLLVVKMVLLPLAA